ncbi:MAG: hypothetical protein GY795_31085 [Desulfobacterales bacterium]|nr:hypothetical protein [Desulfobacterales bacterium]
MKDAKYQILSLFQLAAARGTDSFAGRNLNFVACLCYIVNKTICKIVIQLHHLSLCKNAMQKIRFTQFLHSDRQVKIFGQVFSDKQKIDKFITIYFFSAKIAKQE